jgi:hypothetical protein
LPTKAEYLEALEAVICRKCVDSDGRGTCLIADRECAVKKFLPQILDVVGSTNSTSIDAYEAQLRKTVCNHCAHQSLDGVCSLRNDIDCALDRYFPLIVQVIEETQQRERGRKVL